MCGIAAIFSYGQGAPPVDRDELRRIRERMVSRGPDGEGEWFSNDATVGIAHRRLSIIDLSAAGAQPMFNADRSLAIIFNGEIYNYRALRSQLLADGYQFRSHSDTEVLLALYQIRGRDTMLDRLRGMYAFAIWDEKKRGLFIARDAFGIKPLYYSDNGHTFRLASQVKALLAGGQVNTSPDPAGHVGFFLWGHVPDPYTMCRGIRSLPAGHTMWIDRNSARAPKSFCNITTILADAESEVRGRKSEVSHQISDSQNFSVSAFHAEHLRSALADTVRYHLVSDVPVGVFLSSGLDSITVAALGAEQGGTLHTVTLGFDEFKGTPADEVPLAEEFAMQCGTNHQTIRVARTDFQSERDNLFAAMDQPSIDGVNTYFVSLAAKRAGLKVAMSGLGGDEMFAGYPSFTEIPRAVRALRPFSSIGKPFRLVSHRLIERFTSPKYAGILEYGGTYAGAYLLRRGMFMPWELPQLLEPEMVRKGWEELQPLLGLEQTMAGLTNPRLKVSVLEMCWYMRNQLLRDSDWAGMAHSLEIRVPFVDAFLLKELAPLLAGGNPPTKQDMAKTPISNLPSSIIGRPKTGFTVPVREWLMQENSKPEIRNSKLADRGLRGWAKQVYSQFTNTEPLSATNRQKTSLDSELTHAHALDLTEL